MNGRPLAGAIVAAGYGKATEDATMKLVDSSTDEPARRQAGERDRAQGPVEPTVICVVWSEAPYEGFVGLYSDREVADWKAGTVGGHVTEENVVVAERTEEDAVRESGDWT